MKFFKLQCVNLVRLGSRGRTNGRKRSVPDIKKELSMIGGLLEKEKYNP